MSTVIVCLDGSPLAEEAARTGLMLLRPADSLIFVTVVEPQPTGLAATMPGFGAQPGMPPPVPPDHFETMAEVVMAEGNDVLDRAAALLHIDDAERRVITGKPGEAICALADEVRADAIVMASRGLGGFRLAVLGSVSAYVSRSAPCAVLVVPSQAV
jgi:nucleotide-binding universal stress UspA family protein